MSSARTKFTPEEVEEFNALFQQYDDDGGGDIDSTELGTMLTELGMDVTQDQVDEMLRGIDKDGTRGIDFDEFLSLMWRYRNGGESDDEDDEVTSPQKTQDVGLAVGDENIAFIESMSTEELSAKLEMLLNMKDSLREVFGGAVSGKTGDMSVIADEAAAEHPPADSVAKEEVTSTPPPAPHSRRESVSSMTPAGSRATTPGATKKEKEKVPRRDSAHHTTVSFVIDALTENGFTFSSPGDAAKLRRESAEALAKAVLHTLGQLTECIQERLSLSVDYVEVGVNGFEDDDNNSHRVERLEEVDPTQLAVDLEELRGYTFEEGVSAHSKQGAEAFRHKARDYPFFMFPIETICSQLDTVDQRFNQYVHHIGLNEYLLRPRCPEGKQCKQQENPEHKLQFTHPCYALTTPCPHSNRPMHMKCYHHGDDAEVMTQETVLKEIQKLLGVLDITGFEIGDCGATCLAYVLHKDNHLPKEQRKYRELIAAGNHFSPSGAIPLLDASVDLVKLDLSCNGLGYRGSLLIPGGGVGPSLHLLLQKSDRLTHLNLSRNRLSDNEMRYISDGLKTNTVLKHLDLRKNEFGPSCGEMLAAAMSENRYLSELLMGWNRLEGSGSLELLNELQSSSTVEVLDLSWTGITDEGGKYIARMIAGSAALLQLDVSHNAIGKQSAPLISKALQQNRTLTHFDVSFNPLGDRGTVEIVRDIRENFVLEFLDIRSTKARDETHKEVQQTLRVREPKMKDLQQKILFERELGAE